MDGVAGGTGRRVVTSSGAAAVGALSLVCRQAAPHPSTNGSGQSVTNAVIRRDSIPLGQAQTLHELARPAFAKFIWEFGLAGHLACRPVETAGWRRWAL